MRGQIDPQTFCDPYIANNSWGYLDIEMTDRSRKRLRRLWRLTIPWPDEGGKPYATLRRSVDDQSEFLDDITLPAAFVPIMLEAVGDLAKVPNGQLT